MLRTLLVCLALCALAIPSRADTVVQQQPGNYGNGSVALSTSPVDVLPPKGNRVRVLLLNNSGIGISGGTPIVIWCRWGTVALAPAAVAGVGSFALQPNGGGKDDAGSGVNQGPLNCLSESGTPSLYAEQY